MSTCDVHTFPASVAKNPTDNSVRVRERRIADAASTTTTVSVRRNVRKELQTDAARTHAHPSFARRPAAAPAAAGSAAPARAARGIAAVPGAIATMLAAAVHHVNAARRPSWIALIASAVAAGALVWWVMIERQPAIDASAIMRDNLVAAQQAMREGRFSEPAERSALHYYTTVLALEPTNAAAISGIDHIADHYIDEAKRLIIDGQFAPAALALEKVRRIRPDHRRLPLLDAQLRNELQQLLAQQREASAARAAQALSDAAQAAQKQAEPAKSRAASTGDPQSKSSGQASDAAASLAAMPPASSPSPPHEAPVARLADNAPGTMPSVAGEGASLAPENVQEASIRKTAAGPSSPDAAAGLAAATAAAAAVAASTTQGTDDVALAAIPAPTGAGAASGAAVGPESTSPPAPAPETRSAPAPKARALLRFVQPQYPNEALMRGYEGWVDVSLEVTPAGVVLNPRIEDSSSGRIFNRAALAAVRQWRYQPHDGGAGEPDHMKVRVQFRLDH